MQPLKDLKVLDFSTLLPGPMATLYLADWGAEVLRIEAADRDDLSRSMPPFANGTSTTHAFLNRSKKSLTLDLKTEAGRDKVFELLQDFDVVIEQFRPGVMAKLGLDYETLKSRQPRLVYCSLSGYGQTGPYRQRAGHDVNYAALSGLAAMTGTAANGPILHGDPVCDLSGSYHALIGLLMAVYHRERTGEGQYIDVSITDASLMLSALWLQMALVKGQGPGWEQTVLNGGSFYGYYQTADGGYLSVGGLEPKFLKGFLETIGALELVQLNGTGVDDGRRMRQVIQEKLSKKTRAEWMAIFEGLDLCVEPVLSLDEVVKHPHMQARSATVDVDCGDGTQQKQLASPLRFSEFRPVYRHIGVPKGAHCSIYS